MKHVSYVAVKETDVIPLAIGFSHCVKNILKKLKKQKKGAKIMENNLKVIYMLNGMIIMAEVTQLDQGGVSIKRTLAFIPGDQQGHMNMMEAFPFTDLDEDITLETGAYIAMTHVDDHNGKIIAEYKKAIKSVRERKSGLILP